MRRNRFWVLIFVFSLLSSPVRAGGFAVSGIGAKANGLGGSFRAVADDWSAAYWNPAGLAFQSRSAVTIGGAISSSRIKYVPRTAANGYTFGFASDSTQERFPFDRNIPFALASGFLRFPQLGRFNLGVALFVPHHNQSEWNLFSLPYSFKGDSFPTFTFPEKNFESRLRVADIHPSAAVSLMGGKLALGVGLSVDRADLTLDRPVLTPVEKSYQAVVGEQDTLKSLFANHPELKTRPEENVVSMVHVGMGSWGVGGNAGMLYKPNERFSIGLSYHSPVRFKLKGEYRQRIYYPFNPSKRDARTQVREFFPIEYRFIFDGQGKEILLGPDLARMTLDLPQDFGAGIAFRVNPRWTVAADFSWFNWKKLDSLPVTFEDTAQTVRLGYPTYYLGWKNTIRLSGGVMYNPKPSWSFRAGYFFDQSPVPDSTFSPLFADVGNKHSFNAGFSYLIGGWELAYNLEAAVSKKRDIAQLNGLFINLPGLYKDTRFTSMASVTYRFDIKSE